MSFAFQPNLTQIKEFTADLSQAAGTYDLCTASGKIFIPMKDIACYMSTAGGTLTSVAVQTNQTNATVILTAGEGAVASLLAQKVVIHAAEGAITLESGQKIQYTIVGLTGTGSMKVTIRFTPLTSGGTLS